MRSARAILSDNLRHYRAQRGWSQEDLADESLLHRTYIGSVERGERNISVDNIQKLAEALKLRPWQLLKPR